MLAQHVLLEEPDIEITTAAESDVPIAPAAAGGFEEIAHNEEGTIVAVLEPRTETEPNFETDSAQDIQTAEAEITPPYAGEMADDVADISDARSLGLRPPSASLQQEIKLAAWYSDQQTTGITALPFPSEQPVQTSIGSADPEQQQNRIVVVAAEADLAPDRVEPSHDRIAAATTTGADQPLSARLRPTWSTGRWAGLYAGLNAGFSLADTGDGTVTLQRNAGSAPLFC